MRQRMWWRSACVLVGLACLFVSDRALAGDGWYLGMDVGANLSSGIDLNGTDNDYSTLCDDFINPGTTPGQCDMPPAPAALFNEFDNGGGILAGLSMGYRWRNFRLEGEYFYRGATYDDTDEVRSQDATTDLKSGQELAIIEGVVDDVFSHNFFTNLYYDFHSDSKWTPYVGAGVGFAQVSLDYFTRWARSSEPSDITTFDDSQGMCTGTCVDRRATLAGTTTIGRGNFSDILFGYQAIAGVDYRISDPMTVGLKFRWAGFSEFEDDAEYDALRSHDSTNSADLTDPRSARVRYGVSTDDLSFWGVSLNLKYHFDPGAPVTFVSNRQSGAGDGVYVGMDLGVAVAHGLETNSEDNDQATRCDTFITMEGSTTGCPALAGDKWTNEFDAGAGVLAGLSVGYRWRNFRIEGEYFYRDANYDNANAPDFGGVNIKDLEEIAESEEAIDDVLSHNFFANLYYDVPSNSRWTPYFGVGVGFARVSLDYFARFRRSSNPAVIDTFGTPDDTPVTGNLDVRERLAGTTTIGRNKLSDTLFGWQALAGVDYRISDPVTVGLKFRWADFTEFEGGAEWNQLRSHDSTNSDDPSDPRSARVRYSFATDEITFWGVSLNLKYHF